MNVFNRIRETVSHGLHRFINNNHGFRAGFGPVLETLLGITIVLGIGAFSGQPWGWLNLQPHPLWIVVLAIAVRYGGRNGYVAGALSGIAYGLLVWVRPEARFQPLALPDLLQPFLMTVIGAVMGEIVSARERRVVDLETDLQGTRQDLGLLWERYETVEKLKCHLEKQIAFQPDSIMTLSNLGQRLQSLNVAELHRAIVDLLPELLKVEACSLYLYQRDYLLLEAGAPAEWDGRPTEIGPNHSMIEQVVHEGRPIAIRDLIRNRIERVGDVNFVMAAPLILSDGEVYGVVIIESAPIESISPSSLMKFGAILSWACMALENAIRYEQSQMGLRVNERMMQEAEFSWTLTPGVRRQ